VKIRIIPAPAPAPAPAAETDAQWIVRMRMGTSAERIARSERSAIRSAERGMEDSFTGFDR